MECKKVSLPVCPMSRNNGFDDQLQVSSKTVALTCDSPLLNCRLEYQTASFLDMSPWSTVYQAQCYWPDKSLRSDNSLWRCSTYYRIFSSLPSWPYSLRCHSPSPQLCDKTKNKTNKQTKQKKTSDTDKYCAEAKISSLIFRDIETHSFNNELIISSTYSLSLLISLIQEMTENSCSVSTFQHQTDFMLDSFVSLDPGT